MLSIALTKRLAALLALAIAGSACGPGTTEIEASSSTETASEQVDGETADEPGLFVGDPQDLLLDADVFPESYTVEILSESEIAEETDEECAGVPRTFAEYPPEAIAKQTIGGDHLLSQTALRYPTTEAAAEAFDYKATLMELCHGVAVSSDPDDEKERDRTIFFVTQLTDVKAPPAQADDYAAAVVTAVHPDFILNAHAEIAQVGRWVLWASSSDPTVVEHLAASMIDAIHGTPWTGGTIVPEVAMATLPGPNAAAFWSDPERWPALLREEYTLRSAEPEFMITDAGLAWVEQATDERLDQLASEACAFLYRASDGPTGHQTAVDLIASTVTPAEDRDLNDQYAGLVGAAVAVYCEDQLETLSTVHQAAATAG